MTVVLAVRIELRLPGSHSLKEKRHVVRSMVERLQRRNHFAAAEVGGNDAWQRAVISFCAVGNSERLLRSAVDAALGGIERDWPEVTVQEVEIEALRPFED